MAVRRIAVTGGPGAGKTTVWRTIAAAYGERVLAVPEVATSMLQHVFPQPTDALERRALQRAIFAVQKNLETFHEQRIGAGQVLLCDRGTPDGAGYWPEGADAFFDAMDARWESELERYDAVLFLETAAAGNLSIADGNVVRVETLAAAVAIDRRIHAVWSRHPNFCHVAHQPDFSTKVALGSAALSAWLEAGN